MTQPFDYVATRTALINDWSLNASLDALRAQGDYDNDAIGTIAWCLLDEAIDLEAEGADIGDFKKVIEHLDRRGVILSEGIDSLCRRKYGIDTEDFMIALVASLADQIEADA